MITQPHQGTTDYLRRRDGRFGRKALRPSAFVQTASGEAAVPAIMTTRTHRRHDAVWTLCPLR